MKAKKKVKKITWFGGASFEALKTEFAASGPGARLEIRLVGRGQKMEARVRTPGTRPDTNGWIDDSHVCPPDCE